MMVDTGAELTLVEQVVPDFLRLSPIRYQEIEGVGGRVDSPVYRLQFVIGASDHAGRSGLMTFSSDVVAMPSPPTDTVRRPHVGLIGRDFLRHIRFVYDGPSGTFELIDVDAPRLGPAPGPAPARPDNRRTKRKAQKAARYRNVAGPLGAGAPSILSLAPDSWQAREALPCSTMVEMRLLLAIAALGVLGCASGARTAPGSAATRQRIAADRDREVCSAISAGTHKPTHRELMRCGVLSPPPERQAEILEAMPAPRARTPKPRTVAPRVRSQRKTDALLDRHACDKVRRAAPPRSAPVSLASMRRCAFPQAEREPGK
jgi:hypothetical protein